MCETTERERKREKERNRKRQTRLRFKLFAYQCPNSLSFRLLQIFLAYNIQSHILFELKHFHTHTHTVHSEFGLKIAYASSSLCLSSSQRDRGERERRTSCFAQLKNRIERKQSNGERMQCRDSLGSLFCPQLNSLIRVEANTQCISEYKCV